jgi:hypothetical protein
MVHCSAPEQIAQLYHSLPLGNNGDAIRVIDILPGRKDSDIKIKIRTTRLNSGIAYEALSYSWGDSLEHSTISVQGEYRIGVTDNLHRALKRLRRRFQRRSVWIDQLCINQADYHERSQQVGIMGPIYENARCVHVWLGEAKRSWPSNILEKLASFARHVSGPGIRWRHRLKYVTRTVVDSDVHMSFWQALRNHPEMIQQAIQSTKPCWLDRAWVIQEFSLATKVYFWCGPVAFLYNSERLSLMVQRYNNEEVQRLCTKVNHQMQHTFRRRLALQAKKWMKGEPITYHEEIDIYRVVEWIRGSKATKPVDMVFSVLGLITAEEAAIISSDYSLTPAEVFARATYAAIKLRNNLDVLSFVPWRPVTPELPTWSLDFVYERPSWRYDPLDTEIPKDAPGGVSRVVLDRASRLLTISAASIGTVLDVLPICHHQIIVPDLTWSLWNFVLHGCALVDRLERDTCWSGFEEALGLLERPDKSRKPNEQRKARFHKTTSRRFVEYREGSSLGYQSLLVLLSDAFSMWASGTGTPYRTHRRNPPSEKIGSSAVSEEVSEFAPMYRYASALDMSLVLFVTSAGLIGIAPDTVSKDDQIVLVPSERPFVGLRKAGESYSFCGQVWIWGVGGYEVATSWTKLDMGWEQYVLC